MKKNNLSFKFFVYTILIVFSFIYISVKLGYLEYSYQKKNTLTEEQIKTFESDILKGKTIDINNYITKNELKTDKPGLGLQISNKLSNITRKSIIEIFKMLNKFVDN